MSIKVSVCCTTYNHESYLERCLDSLVCQKTNFKYEILVFEDCSTDSTKEILKKYVEKYPDIVKVVHQPNGGHGEGINQGIKNSFSDYCLHSNSYIINILFISKLNIYSHFLLGVLTAVLGRIIPFVSTFTSRRPLSVDFL